MGKLFVFLFLLIPFFSVSQNTIFQSSADRYFRTGLELMDKEKFGAAQKSFGRYIDLERGDAKEIEARMYVALCGLYLFHSDAEAMLSQFIEEHPRYSRLDRAFFDLGDFYFRNKKYKKSLEYLERVEERFLDNQQRLERAFKLGYANFALRQFDQSLPYFDQAKSQPGSFYSAANYYAGYVQYRQRRYGQALADLKKAEESPAYKPVVPYLIANVLNQQKRYDELIRYVENEIDLKSNLKNKSEIYLLLGEGYFQKGNYDEAAKSFDMYKATGAKPGTDLAYRIGVTYLMTGQEGEAIEYFKAVASQVDTLGQYASYYLGQLYTKQGNAPFAASAFSNASQMDFDPRIKLESTFQFGKVNYELGRYRLAISTLQSFLSNHPNSSYTAEAHELLSQSYLNTNDYQLALEFIESLSSHTPKIRQVYQQVTYKQGIDYFNQELYSKAVESLEKSLSYPSSADLVMAANYWIGEAYSIGKRYDQAIRAYRSIYKVDDYQQNPYYLKSQYGLGYAYFNTGDYQAALDSFRGYVGGGKKTQGQVFFGDAVLRLADCHYALKNYDQALANYKEVAVNSKANGDYALYQMGVIYGVQGNLTLAVQNLNRMLVVYPNSIYQDDAKFEMAQVNFQNGRYEAAEAAFSTLLASEPQSPYIPYALLRRGLARNNLGNVEATIQDYQTILNEHAQSPAASAALLGLQEALTRQNRTKEFEDYLARYKAANPDDEALPGVEYEAAKTLYFNQQYAEAIDRFTTYISTYPETASAYESRFYIAESYYRLDQVAEALPYYHQVIDAGPSIRANRAVNRVADLELDQGNYNKALIYYRKLGSQAQTRKEELGALIGQMQANFLLDQYDSAVLRAEEILAKGDLSSRIQNEALLCRGKVSYSKGDFDAATDDFLTILNTAKDEAGAEAQFLLARIFHEQQQYPQSLETLYDLNANFSSYSGWLNQSFLLIADNFVQMGELFQAQETLKSIIENATDSSTVSLAKKKLSEVEERQKQSIADNAGPDSTQLIID